MFDRIRLIRLFVIIVALAANCVFALSADEAMEKSKAWFKSGKAWNLEFRDRKSVV